MRFMTMKSARLVFLFQFILMPMIALAETEVLEGKDAKHFLEKQQNSALILSQKDKVFILNNLNILLRNIHTLRLPTH